MNKLNNANTIIGIIGGVLGVIAAIGGYIPLFAKNEIIKNILYTGITQPRWLVVILWWALFLSMAMHLRRWISSTASETTVIAEIHTANAKWCCYSDGTFSERPMCIKCNATMPELETDIIIASIRRTSTTWRCSLCQSTLIHDRAILGGMDDYLTALYQHAAASNHNMSTPIVAPMVNPTDITHADTVASFVTQAIHAQYPSVGTEYLVQPKK